MVATVKIEKHGLLQTPPMPEGLPEAKMGDNARQVLLKDMFGGG